MKAIVIGGTGPTGHFIVNGLLRRGYTVSILHSGRHEVDEIPPEVEHIHTDAYDGAKVADAIRGHGFDLCVAAYGRLRAIAEVTVGQVGRFVSIGGLPGVRGYMNPMLFEPAGMPVPSREDAPRTEDPVEDSKGYRVAQTEDRVFQFHPDATHLRYPYVYGPYQPVPREWCIVRRVLDGRPFIVLPDGGLTLHHFGYAENLAHALLLAVDQPEAACGQLYNAADAEILTLRQVTEVLIAALADRQERPLEIVSMPWALATPARPLVTQPLTTHRVMSTAKLERELGYRDAVPPREALRRTARWLAANPPEPGGWEERILEDPFEYAAEDALVAAWRKAVAAMPEIPFETEPGYGMAYSGPGGRSRMHETFTDTASETSD
ncbi:MAG: NAD-dependent dehydratase [Myxococcota bacterium]